MTDHIIRFALGGVMVALFSAIGEVWQPKRFAGIFSAAPSVALGSLVLAFHGDGVQYVMKECEAMAIGSVAFALYAVTSVALCAKTRLPVWSAAIAAWAAWFSFSGVALFVATRAGLL